MYLYAVRKVQDIMVNWALGENGGTGTIGV